MARGANGLRPPPPTSANSLYAGLTRAHTSSTHQTSAATRSIPHTAIRKRIASHMVQSLLQTAPHVTTVFEADLTAIQAHRSAHRADFDSRECL